MDIGALFLVLAVFLLAGFFVARPFFERRTFAVTSADQMLSSLLAERDRLIGALQELDFDHTLGKIPAQDYPALRATMLQNAAEVLRKIDKLQSNERISQDAESRLEAVIASRRADASGKEGWADVAPVISSDEDLEERIAARRAARKEKAAGFCPGCGKPVMSSDRFCPSCGKSID